MNTNQKKCNLLIQTLFFVFPLICSQNSFALKETVIKITDIPQTAPASLIFNEPGKQKVTIENHSQKDVNIGNLYSIADEFTATIISRGTHTSFAEGCSRIKTGTSCSFVVGAQESASSSINPDGELFFLNYKSDGEQGDKFIPFKIKLDYNNDIIFEVRNLAFNGNEATFMEIPHFEQLTIINNNPSFVANIKNIHLAKRNTDFVIGDYRQCSALKSNGTCKVGIGIDFNTQNDVIPIYVTYDLVNVNGAVVKKDLLAVAAAIVNYHAEAVEHDVQPLESVFSGDVAGWTIVVPYAEGAQKFIKETIRKINKKVFVVILPKRVDVVTDIVTGILAGSSYFLGDKIIENTVEDYDSGYYGSKIISATTAHSIVALAFCPRENAGAFGFCVAATVGCGLLGTFGGEAITDVLYSNIVYHLPEQSWYERLKAKSKITKLPVDFLSAAALRVGCKAMLGVPNGGFTELYQDTSSATVMVALENIFKKRSELLVPENVTSNGAPVYDHIGMEEVCSECICADLPYNS